MHDVFLPACVRAAPLSCPREIVSSVTSHSGRYVTLGPNGPRAGLTTTRGQKESRLSDTEGFHVYAFPAALGWPRGTVRGCQLGAGRPGGCGSRRRRSPYRSHWL